MGRTILAVIAGYLVDGILVSVTEQFLTWYFPGFDTMPSFRYCIVDLITQSVYTIIGGYVCCLIARSRPIAIFALVGVGILVGTISLITSWQTEPHWYGAALLAVYPPCAWIGWTMRNRTGSGANKW